MVLNGTSKGFFERKNGTRSGDNYQILFKLKNSLFHSYYPQSWHIIALDQLKCDFSKTGHLWGIFHHNGEQMGNDLFANQPIFKPGIKPSSLLI